MPNFFTEHHGPRSHFEEYSNDLMDIYSVSNDGIAFEKALYQEEIMFSSPSKEPDVE